MCMYAEIKPTVRDTVGINRLSIAWLVDFRVCGNNAILMKLNQIMAIDDSQRTEKHLDHEILHSLLINVFVSNEQNFLFKIEKLFCEFWNWMFIMNIDHWKESLIRNASAKKKKDLGNGSIWLKWQINLISFNLYS